MYMHVYDNLSLLNITWFMNFVQIMGNKEANEKSPWDQNLEPNLQNYRFSRDKINNLIKLDCKIKQLTLYA